MAGENILAALQNPLYSAGETYSGIGAGALAQSLPALVDPYASNGQNAAYVFGGSILAALLGNMAKSDAAEENAAIATKQANFMNADPAQRLAMTQQDPRTFSKLQAALNTNSILQETQDRALIRQQEIMQPFDVAKEERSLQNQISLQTNPELRAAQIADSVNKKRGERLGELQADSLIFGDDPLKNPKSPEYAINKDKEDKLITIRREFNGLPVVQNFAKASQSAQALAGALKDKGGVSDQELVRYSILMIEPGMAVREGEQAAVANSQSIPDSIKGAALKALNGESALDDQAREGIKRLAARAYSSHKNLYDQANGLYSKEAQLQDLDPSRLSYMGEAPDVSSVFGDPNQGLGSQQQPVDTNALAELKRRGIIP